MLSRFPLLESENHDISVTGREERGCLRVDVGMGKENRLHIYNVHLGTSFIERRHQARKLISESILSNATAGAARPFSLGDFNEWTRGLATRLLNEHFQSGDIRLHLKRSRSYPGMLPSCTSITSTSRTKRSNWNTPNCIAAARRCSPPTTCPSSPISDCGDYVKPEQKRSV